jgi:hypothetical protein
VVRPFCAIDDRLIRQDLEFLPNVKMIVRPNLSHHNPDHFFDLSTGDPAGVRQIQTARPSYRQETPLGPGRFKLLPHYR